jgi:hypothetical protein
MFRDIDIEPAKEEEFRYLQSWLAFSDRLDRLIEATGPSGRPEQVPTPTLPGESFRSKYRAALRLPTMAD